MDIDAGEFRKVMGHFATGVTLVTGTDEEGEAVGLTANAVASVSLDPPLLLVCLDGGSATRPVLLRTQRFGVSILRARDEALARRFAMDTTESRFEDVGFHTEITGAPLLARALGWLDCRLWGSMEAGDHTILVGRVVACGAGDEGPPLVFYQGDYGTVSS